MSGLSEREEQQLEQQHMMRVCNSFAQYAFFQQALRKSLRKRLDGLPDSSKKFLPEGLISSSADAIGREKDSREAEARNQHFLDQILSHIPQPTSTDHAVYKQQANYAYESNDDISKVQSVLKSCVRDWTAEGAEERAQCYDPVIAGTQKWAEPGGKVLVPGSGLGRLALELASRGYAVQGNDFSIHMLMASDFILNACGTGEHDSFEISPYLGTTLNSNRVSDAARKFVVPDVDPKELLFGSTSGDQQGPDFSMAAGEFLDCYNKPEEKGLWSCVASCFFLDTAPDIVAYFTCIWNMLKPGGSLINLGPLLFHWSGPNMRPDETKIGQYSRLRDNRYLESVDFCWEDVREILIKVGFKIEDEQTGLDCTYTRDSESFMYTSYKCVYFVAVKPKADVEGEK